MELETFEVPTISDFLTPGLIFYIEDEEWSNDYYWRDSCIRCSLEADEDVLTYYRCEISMEARVSIEYGEIHFIQTLIDEGAIIIIKRLSSQMEPSEMQEELVYLAKNLYLMGEVGGKD